MTEVHGAVLGRDTIYRSENYKMTSAPERSFSFGLSRLLYYSSERSWQQGRHDGKRTQSKGPDKTASILSMSLELQSNSVVS